MTASRYAPDSAPPLLRLSWRIPAVVLVAIASGVLVPVSLPLALAPVAVLLIALLTISAPFRLIFLIFGGLATLQSAQDLSLVKLFYMLGVVVSVVAILFHTRMPDEPFRRSPLRYLLPYSFILIMWIVMSSAISLSNGISFPLWVRDAAPYFLFAIIPLFALDAQSIRSIKWIVTLFAFAGLLSSLSFMLEWMDRRGLTDIELTRSLMYSFLLSTALFAYATARAILDEEHRRWWLVISAAIVAMIGITGTRSTVILFIIPLIVMMISRQRLSDNIGRFASLIAIVVVVTWIGGWIAANSLGVDISQLTSRFTSIPDLLGNSISDPSYQERIQQTAAARQAFLDRPLFGQGPGYMLEWSSASGAIRRELAVDTGWIFPAKFGMIGVAVIAFTIIGFVQFLRHVPHNAMSGPARVAIISYGILVLVRLVLGSPFEDKGFSFGLLFLIALCIADPGRAEHVEPRFRGEN